MVERLEELLGTVQWLRTDQARKGAYRHDVELRTLLASMEELLTVMEELPGRQQELSEEGDRSDPESATSLENDLDYRLHEMDTAIQALSGDRAVIRKEEIGRLSKMVQRMERRVRNGSSRGGKRSQGGQAGPKG
jgi:hypothetical protein